MNGIQKLRKLSSLTCAYFRNVHEIEKLPSSTTKLDLANFPNITNIKFSKKLINLTDFDIDNCKEIESLSPLSNLKNLKRLRLIGNTKVNDGYYSFERYIKN